MKTKQKSSTFSRRTVLEMSAIAGASLATGCAIRSGSNWEFFTNDEAATLTAICDQIIPADDFSSASQAGVLNYIDKQITRHYRRHQRAYRKGLERVDQLSQQHCGKALTSASPTEQLQIVISLEKSDTSFFDLVRSHTSRATTVRRATAAIEMPSAGISSASTTLRSAVVRVTA